MKAQPRKRCRSGAGAALVIVLAFIVLIAALMVLFFTQAISYRNIGNSSFNNFKSTALAQSGLATVVGDLQQEITNGSTTINYGTTTFPTNVYYPTTNFNAVPQRQANVPATIPNLIRTSRRTDPIVSPGVGSRASADSSTNAAVSGQYISPSRWNQHYLIPRLNAGTSGIDTTPISDFTNFCAPDWVYVTSGGPTVITAPSTKVFGRYAYAIYDEGGLLDANVAGFPSNTSTNAVHPASPTTYQNNSYGAALPVWGSGLKGTEAFADLTAIGLTQAQIDQLVGWRHNATAQPTGTYNSYTFNATSAVNYHDWMVNATNGFLTTSGHSWTDPTTSKTDTDQVFASRQALIAFANDANPPISQDALQYLATFTRDTEQPSYNPPVGRPLVQNSTSVNTAPFGTGNDAWSHDRSSLTPTTNAPTDINPPFLAVRVSGTFTRADGTVAQSGDPLLKERFPLSRLSLLTSSAFNFSTPPATGADNDPIYRYFGLYRGSAGVAWQYNHDPNITAGIARLSDVAALSGSIGSLTEPREPDFFELLKAAINVGSIGKGAAYSGFGTPGTEGTLVQARDNLTALQILQIGANIIDQSKADNFPTRIQFFGDTTIPVNEVRGSEDLPYLYRERNWITRYTTSGGTAMGALFLQPELWDPYSYSSQASSGLGSSAYVTASNTPKNFRVRMAPDPSLLPSANPLIFKMYYAPPTTQTDLSTLVTVNASLYPSAPPAPLTFNAGELNSYWGFREPTLLGVSTMPATCNMTATPYTDAYTGKNMTGLVVATFPWYSTPPSTTNYAYQYYIYGTTGNCIRFYLDYQDNNGNWITYDESPVWFEQTGASLDLHVYNANNYTQYNSGTTSKEMMANVDWCGGGRTDPRTSRWGFFYGEFFASFPIVDASNNEYGSYRADGGISYGSHNGGFNDLGFAGNFATYGKQYRGFEYGYWAENSVRPSYQYSLGIPAPSGSDGEATPYYRYNRDPDGVPRRTMGGYVTDTSNGGTAVSANEPIIGMPMAIGSGSVADAYSATVNAALATTAAASPAYASRPTILHRPFRSVAELGYAFRDTPWGNINFSFPESGDSPLLDVFCINDTSSTNGEVAGRVNLNTRQAPVLAALMSGSLRDKDDSTNPLLSQTMASQLAAQLVARTGTTTVSSTTQGPLQSRADLVGTWMGPSVPAPATSAATSAGKLKGAVPPDPNIFYTGFSNDIGSPTLVPSVSTTPNLALITRQRESVVRALVDSGTARTWNLLIDLVAQSGQFPPTSNGFSNFVVEGEKHYWLHVAIDRYTGKIIDSQLEVVSE